MGVSAKEMGTTLIVRLDGELDVHSALPFKEIVSQSFRRNPRLRHLVVTMDGVTFIDSTGIGALLGRYREITDAGGRFKVAGASPHVRRLLAMSGVIKLIGIYESEGEALASL